MIEETPEGEEIQHVFYGNVRIITVDSDEKEEPATKKVNKNSKNGNKDKNKKLSIA